MSAVVRRIETASGFKKRHLMYTRVKVRVPLFFWWLCWSDPYLGREGLITHIEWDVSLGEQYTVLFGDSDTGVKQIYSERNLEFLEE